MICGIFSRVLAKPHNELDRIFQIHPNIILQENGGVILGVSREKFLLRRDEKRGVFHGKRVGIHFISS